MSTSDDNDGVKVVMAVLGGDNEWRVEDTGLRGWFDVENGQFVLPFDSGEDAVDVLRILAQSIARETDDAGDAR